MPSGCLMTPEKFSGTKLYLSNINKRVTADLYLVFKQISFFGAKEIKNVTQVMTFFSVQSKYYASS